MAYPTGETKYNYFDTLTRWYWDCVVPPSSYPQDFLFDEIEFYRGPAEENDDQVYSIAGTWVAATGRLIVTWSRKKTEDRIRHEVQYAFSDIHRLGWERAKPAPGGTIAPPGTSGYNGMVYDTAAISLSGMPAVFLAIKPENSRLFSQIRIPAAPTPTSSCPGPPPGRSRASPASRGARS